MNIEPKPAITIKFMIMKAVNSRLFNTFSNAVGVLV
jgi:hypothetical protein